MEPTYDPRNPFDATDVVSSGDQGAGRPRRAVVGTLLTVALLAAGATGVALASDNGSATPTPGSSGSASPSPEGSTGGNGDRSDDDERRGPGMRGFGHRFGGPGMFGLMGAVHGEVVVPKDGGGYQTLLMQRGKATKVSASSITVKSEDGFTATYDVTDETVVGAGSDGITGIDDNADVVVTARKTAGGGTALRVIDLSNLPDLGTFRHHFDRDGDGDGDKGGSGSGTPSPGTTSSSSVGI
jgi:hypothetical protein